MISKKLFVKAFKTMKQQADKETTFIDALQTLSPTTYCDCFLYDEYQDVVIDLLTESFGEKVREDIEYFLYELSYLWKDEKEFKDSNFPKDENGNILYYSVETLYDYLCYFNTDKE